MDFSLPKVVYCFDNFYFNSISGLVEKLCKNYGPRICDVNGVAYHAFPNFDELADPKVKDENFSLSYI